MFSKTANRIWRGIAVLCIPLLVISIGVGSLAEKWKYTLDEEFGTSSTKIVTDGEGNYDYEADYENTTDLIAAHKDLAIRLQQEGSVLLKNENNALPLTQTNPKVTLFGMRSHSPQYGGQIGSSPPANQNVSLIEAMEDRDFDLNETMLQVYETVAAMTGGDNNATLYVPNRLSNNFSVSNDEKQYDINEPPLSALNTANASWRNSIANYSDAGIVVVGRPSTEAADFYPGERGTETEGARNVLGLSKNERDIIDVAIAEKNSGNLDSVIIIVNSDNPMELEELQQNPDVDAILWVGAVGNYGFLGVADLLLGTANPSGHLGDIYATDSTSSPAMQNFGIYVFDNTDEIEPGGTTNYRGNWYLIEAEGIYTGYRYYETRYYDAVVGQGNAASDKGVFDSTGDWDYTEEVSYAFGYGLSYTSFAQTLDSVTISQDFKTATVKVTVENTGSLPGKEVVQLYAQAPYTDYDIANGVEKSAVVLLDFGKTKELAPGATEQITMEVDLQNLASYDYINAKTYTMAEGDYYFAIGSDSHDALNNILAAQGYTTTGTAMDYNGDAAKVSTKNFGTLGMVFNYTDTKNPAVTTKVNTTLFGVSKAGVAVTNHLDDADFNYWDETSPVTYLSRSDWSGTWPKSYTGLSAPASMIPQLRNDTYEIQQNDDTSDILFSQNHGMFLYDLKGKRFDHEDWDLLLEQMSLSEAMNTIAFGQNIVRAMPSIGLFDVYVQDGPMGFHNTISNRSRAGTRYYVSPDDPNADYQTRDIPTAVVIAYTFSKQLAEENGILFGNDSLFNGQTIIWAPGMNLHRTPYNGRNHEYYSEDPVLSGLIGSAVINGALTKGMIMAPKHFAFNDQESNRAGVAPFMNEQKARELELRSFQIAFENGAMGTMTAFNRIGATFLNAHVGVMNDILREEWAFKGYIITDMINGAYYMTLKETLMAGVTNLDTSATANINYNGAWSYWRESNIQNDRAMLLKIKESMHYLLYTIVNSNAMNGLDETSRMVWNMTWWRGMYISLISVFGVLTLASAGLYAASAIKSKKKEA